MTKAHNVTDKTPLARWLFEHDVSLREGARFFKTNRTYLGRYAKGEATPTGETRELISAALVGEMSIDDLRHGGAHG